MAEKQTTTDPTEDSGAQDAQPEEEVTTDAAVTTAADEPETTPSEDESESSTNESEEAEEADSEDVADWARKKGLPLSEKPTENELKLAEMQRNAERKMHETTTRSSELENAVGEQIDEATANNPDISASDARIAKIEAEVAVEKFFRSNPDASRYETKMAELVRDNPARARLPLEDLHQLAVANSGEREDAEKAGGRKALEGLARKQKAAAPKGNAVSSTTSGSAVTRAAIDEAVKTGDDAWLKENRAEIDRMVAEGRL